jgi:hypothetical protein
MKVLDVYKLSEVPTRYLWDNITGSHNVLFEDGLLEMTGTEIAGSSHLWKMCLRYKATITKETSITFHKKNELLVSRSIHEAQNSTIWHIVDYLRLSYTEMYHILKDVLIANNLLYNDIVTHCGEFIKSVDILDFINLTLDDAFLAKRKEVDDAGYDNITVGQAMAFAEDYIMYNAELRLVNNIAWLVSRGLAKAGPVVQATFMRGFVYDVDKLKIPVPITSNLIEGMCVTGFNLLTREASVHMAAGNGDIQDTTIDGRKLSYVCNVKNRIAEEDCGTKQYFGVKITETSGHLHAGQWYTLDPNDHNLIKFKAGDEIKLMGQYIHKRSSFRCETSNPANSCAKCMGDMAYSFIQGRAIGISMARAIATDFIQKSISTKHYAASNASNKKELSPDTRRVFVLKRTNFIYMQKKITGKLVIRVPSKAVEDLERIHGVNPSMVSRSQLTNISCGEILRTTTKGTTELPFDIKAMLSPELALFISENYDRVVSRKGGDCYINIEEFDSGKHPIFERAEILESARQNSKEIMSKLNRGGDTKGSLGSGVNDESYMETYVELLDAMGISAAALEFIYSAYFMPKNNCGLTHDIVDVRHASLSELIDNRSKSVTMLHSSKKVNFVFNPNSVLNQNTPDNALDVFVDPVRVVKHYKESKIVN